MEDENIYDDLDDFILEQRVEQVQENNKDLQQTIEKLEETTKRFNEEISTIKEIKQNLERNISSLFKTAKNEIERKDRKITELTRELDVLKLKRVNNKPDTKDTKLIKELDALKGVVEQKNRIIQSLTKEIENVKQGFSHQDNRGKRMSHGDEDLRNRLGKKRKLDDTSEYKSRRPRSRSPRSTSPRFDRRRNHTNGSDKCKKQRYTRSRSPPQRQKVENRSHHYRQDDSKKYRSPRSSSIDRKKHEILDKKIKCEPKLLLLHNQLLKEDSGMSSSNSQTSELIVKNEEIKKPPVQDDLEEGEIDCSLEDIHSEEENYSKEESQEPKPPIIDKVPENPTPHPKENALDLLAQSYILDNLDIDEEITKMQLMEDDKRKKRKEDKARISKLRSAISECKQNIELLEHNISSDEDSELEEDANKTGVLEANSANNLVLKISKGSIVHSEQINNETIESDKENIKTNEKQVINTIVKTENTESVNKVLDANVLTDIVDEGNNQNSAKNDETIENNVCSVEQINVDKPSINTMQETEIVTERKAPLRAKRRRAFICIT